jgi:hypothetical protein
MLAMESSRVRAFVRVDRQRQTRMFDIQYAGMKPPIRIGWAEAHPDVAQACAGYFRNLETQRGRLQAAWTLLHEAEEHLFALGYQPVQVRRLYLERIKALRGFLTLSAEYDLLERRTLGLHKNPLAGNVTAYKQLRTTLREALKEASKTNVFWERLADCIPLDVERA